MCCQRVEIENRIKKNKTKKIRHNTTSKWKFYNVTEFTSGEISAIILKPIFMYKTIIIETREWYDFQPHDCCSVPQRWYTAVGWSVSTRGFSYTNFIIGRWNIICNINMAHHIIYQGSGINFYSSADNFEIKFRGPEKT